MIEEPVEADLDMKARNMMRRRQQIQALHPDGGVIGWTCGCVAPMWSLPPGTFIVWRGPHEKCPQQ